MSDISMITQAQGFDQQRYESFLERARAERVDASVVDSLLLNAIKGGKSFDQALALVGSDLPKLTTPTGVAMALLKDWPAIPSPGALIMSATTEFAAEQRRQNQEFMWQETEAIAQSMKDQAQKMRSAAITQLVLGVVSGAIQMGLGITQAVMGAAAAKAAKTAMDEAMAGVDDALTAAKLGSEAFNSVMMNANTNISAVGQIGGGGAKIIEAWAQFEGAHMQAKVKEMEADQEKMRAVRDSVKNLDDGLRDLIHKALAAQNDIQASTNQARTKILA